MVDGVLLGALVPLARVQPRLQVDDHPDVARGVQLECLHHEAAGVRGGAPVDAAQGVAGGVVARAAGVGRDVVGAAAEAALAGQAGGGRLETGQVHHAGIDEDLLRAPIVAGGLEDAEGVAPAHAQRPPLVEAAAAQGRLHHPAVATPRGDGERAAGAVAGQVAGVLHLHPELGQDAAVAHLDQLLRLLPHLRAQGAALGARLQPARVQPRQQQREGRAQGQQVGHAVEQPEARAGGDEEGRGEQHDERRERAPPRREGPGQRAPHGGPPQARARAPGTGTRARQSATTSASVAPFTRAPGFTITRCPSVTKDSSFTSSGTT